MVKKLLTIIMGLGLAIGAQAQVAQEDILMWVGDPNGDATAVVTVIWSNPDTGFAWGVRYDSEEMLDPITALEYIAAGDPRFSVEFGEEYWAITGINTLSFNDGTLDLSLGTSENPCVYIDEIISADPDEWYYEWCDEEEGTITVAADCYLDYSHVAPAQPLAEPEEESTIAAADILYWVGSGADSAIFVLDWGTGARAWGYLFNAGDTIGTMIAAIDAADPRFANAWGMIAYTEYPIHADLSMSRIKANGTFASESTALTAGMIVKLGTPATNVWDTPITPATIVVTPTDATISSSEISYWAGSGSDSLVIAFNWGDPDTALAWGLLYNGPLTIHDAVLALVAADSRLYVDTVYGAINNVMYSDGTDSLYFRPSASPLNTIQFVLDGNGWAGWDNVVSNGSFLKLGESAYATGVDTTWYGTMGYPAYVVWPTKIYAVSEPNGNTEPEPVIPDDASISASQILYWVGTGSNQVILAVNWADTALAWGFRFSAATTTVQEAMDSIQANDPRFSYTMGDYGVDDILFARAAGDTLRRTSGYWETKHNGIGGDLGYTQTLVNGDFEKWAEPAAGVVVDSSYYEGWGWSYIYAYTMEVHPVSVPTTTGIEAVADIALSVYPNPASEVVNVSFQALRSNTEATIYDAAGRQVYSHMLPAGATAMRLSATNMPEGIYMLRIGGSATKIVVRH